jgi:hypothetical protein
MQSFHSRQPRILALVFLSVFAWTLSSKAQITATWQPIPSTGNNGPPTQPTIVSGNTVIMQGRNARTLESFSGPLTIDVDVSLAARTDFQTGVFTLSFIPVGLPNNTDVHDATWFQLIYRQPGFGTDVILISKGSGAVTTNVFPQTPFPVVAGQTNHVTFGVVANHALSLAINGNSYALPAAAIMELNTYQLQLQGLGENDIWTASNITLVPEPNTVMLVGVSLLGLATVVRHRKRTAIEGVSVLQT